MSELNRYLGAVYRHCGKGPDCYNCWSLTRAVRCDLYGCASLQEWGDVLPTKKRQVTDAWHEAVPLLKRGAAERGSIACVFKGRLLLHVAVVVEADRGLSVLEILPETGPRIMTVARFERLYNRVEYWNDRDLPNEHS